MVAGVAVTGDLDIAYGPAGMLLSRAQLHSDILTQRRIQGACQRAIHFLPRLFCQYRRRSFRVSFHSLICLESLLKYSSYDQGVISGVLVMNNFVS
jgi:hypothetical protein